MSSRARLGTVTVLAILAVVATTRFGVWQFEKGQARDAWGERLASASLVTLRGYWLPEHTVYLENRPMGGKTGFYVVTPLFQPKQNTVTVVERGWVQRDFRERTYLPEVQTPAGEVAVTGRRVDAPSRLFSLDSRTEEGVLRLNLDLAQYHKQIGQPLEVSVLREVGADSQGLSRRWDNPATGSAKNYAYAVQWFAMSALVCGLYFWFVWIKPRRTV